MNDDITPPSSAGNYIHYKHSAAASCRSDTRTHPLASQNYQPGPKVTAERERLDTLAAHCVHPADQISKILMQRYTETEYGVTLEAPEEVDHCNGCGRTLWERSAA